MGPKRKERLLFSTRLAVPSRARVPKSPSPRESEHPMNDSIPPRSSGMHSVVGTTLREHVLFGMRAAPGATGEFTSLLNHVSLAMRIITSRVRSAGLAGMLGYTGETNVQGEAVQKLDAYANEVLVTVLERSGHACVIGSEELDEVVINDRGGKYVVLF